MNVIVKREQFKDQLWVQFWDHLRSQLVDQFGDRLWCLLRSWFWAQLGEQIMDSLGGGSLEPNSGTNSSTKHEPVIGNVYHD